MKDVKDIKKEAAPKSAAKSNKQRDCKNCPKNPELAKKKSGEIQNEKKAKSKSKPINIKLLGGLLFSKMAKSGALRLGKKADEVNKLNVFPVPDGDTGDNMRMTIESGIAAIESMDSDNLADVMKALSHGMLLGARGNSGVILSQFFAGTAKGLEKTKKADPATFGKALELGVQQADASVMTPTEGTILTVAREAVEYAVSRINEKSTIRTLFADLVKEMNASLERTPETLVVLKEAGVVDSGGAGLLYIMDGFNRVLNGEEDKDDAPAAKQVVSRVPTSFAFNENSEMTYGYCTELLLQLQHSKTDIDSFDVEALKSFLVSVGDSVVAFKTESIVKLHVHTFTPEVVLSHCRQFGEFLTVKIENMSVQHTESAEAAPEEETVEKPKKVITKKNGVVAVTNGSGIAGLYRELGADEIINGGQTQNPSTNDFLAAFEKIAAENIFVFPNNGNIIMAAQQAAEIYEDAKVHVIPNKNIGTGYAALTAYDPDSDDIDGMLEAMSEAMGRVTAGCVSPSIRDTEMNGLNIAKGDTIGIIEKKIVLNNKDRAEASLELASMLLDAPEKTMLTVFAGVDTTDDESDALISAISEKYPDADVFPIRGDQEVYPYIFVAE